MPIIQSLKHLQKTRFSPLPQATLQHILKRMTNPPPFQPAPPTDYILRPLPLEHQPTSLIENGLRGQAMFLSMNINNQETPIILQDPQVLAQLITEGMNLAMFNYMNHLWLANILDPIAPALAPALMHNMQAQWQCPHHFNPLNNTDLLYQLPFYTPQEMINLTPLLYQRQPYSIILSCSDGHTSGSESPSPQQTRTRRTRNGVASGNNSTTRINIIHKNFKYQRSQNHVIPTDGGQEIYLQTSDNTLQVLARYQATAERSSREHCNSFKPVSEGEQSNLPVEPILYSTLNQSTPNE